VKRGGRPIAPGTGGQMPGLAAGPEGAGRRSIRVSFCGAVSHDLVGGVDAGGPSDSRRGWVER